MTPIIRTNRVFPARPAGQNGTVTQQAVPPVNKMAPQVTADRQRPQHRALLRLETAPTWRRRGPTARNNAPFLTQFIIQMRPVRRNHLGQCPPQKAQECYQATASLEKTVPSPRQKDACQRVI